MDENRKARERHTRESHGHVCGPGRIDAYQRIDLNDGTIVQVGICVGCRQVIARRYVITGPGTGPWTVLLPALDAREVARREAWQQYPEATDTGAEE